MVKAGDRVRMKDGVIDPDGCIGVVDHVTDRHELMPHGVLVAFPSGCFGAFRAEDMEVIDGAGTEG